jgi:hypothetical protein
MGVVSACALLFISKYLHHSCGPKPMTRIDINDNNQSSNWFVVECLVCQENKVETINIPGLLQPLAIPNQCWEKVSMDFIIGLQKSEGKNVIMVIVDRLTKYAHFCSLTHPFKASTVVIEFMETVQKLHGGPKIIVSDRDLIFTGHFWTELFSCLGTQLDHSSSYHPQSDGQTEIVKKFMEGYLHCFVSDKQTQWFKWLPLAEWWYNTSFHTAIKLHHLWHSMDTTLLPSLLL